MASGHNCLAKRMGMGHLFPWDGDWHEPMYEEYRRFGTGRGKDLASIEQGRIDIESSPLALLFDFDEDLFDQFVVVFVPV